MDTSRRRRELEIAAAAAAESALEAVVAAVETANDDWRGETAGEAENATQPASGPLTASSAVDQILKVLYSPEKIKEITHIPWTAGIKRRSPAGKEEVLSVLLNPPSFPAACFSKRTAQREPPPVHPVRPVFRVGRTTLRTTVRVPPARYALALAPSSTFVDELHQAAHDALQRLGEAREKKFTESLQDWIPSSSPTLGDRRDYGVDRSIDASCRLAGTRVPPPPPAAAGGGGEALDDAVRLLIACAKEGAKPDLILCGSNAWVALGGMTSVYGPMGRAEVSTQRYLPEDAMYAIDRRYWLISGLEPALMWRHSAVEDSVEISAWCDDEFVCVAPWANAVRL